MLHALIKRLQEERASLWEQQKALLDTAAAENRELSAEENGQYETRNTRMNEIHTRVKELVDDQQRARESEEAFAALLAAPVAAERRDEPKRDELREWLKGESGSRHFDVKPQGPVNFRTLSKLSATAGLNTVPTSFYDQLIAHLIEVSGIMMAGPTVLNTDSGESLQIPKTTAHGGGALVAEAGTIGASDPTFGQVTMSAYKYGVLIQVSNELLTDTAVDLDGYLSMQAGRALGNALGGNLITGTGSSQPAGIVTGATLGVTGAASVVGVPNADNLIDLFFSVIAPYRNSPSCGWLLRDATLAVIRKFKDTTNQYLWQPSLQVGAPDTILGKPVYTDPFVAATALSAKSVLFGDISQYYVRMVNGLRFERSDDFAFSTDLVTFRCLIRADGVLVDQTGAVKYFQGNAA
jgi:HK97 family phage major capsid protein